MLTMDGDPVEPNDMVWDNRDGTGIVQSVYADYFTAKFGKGGRTRRITAAGVLDGRNARTVFWAPNDFFIPRKQPALYKKQRRAVIAIMSLITDFAGTAPVIAEPSDDG